MFPCVLFNTNAIHFIIICYLPFLVFLSWYPLPVPFLHTCSVYTSGYI
jgi:hypothetical protein